MVSCIRNGKRNGFLESTDAENMQEWGHSGGFSVDGSVQLQGWDRQGLERVVRYCARPPFAGERFAKLKDGRVAYALPKPAIDGRTLLVMEPLSLLDKLAKLIPPPRAHQVRYFGVLAPHSKLREKVVATAGPSAEVLLRMQSAADKMDLGVELGKIDSQSQAQRQNSQIPNKPIQERNEEQKTNPKAKPKKAARMWVRAR